ncbi:MAG: DinB family protein [Daejeonella sp.]
MSLSGQQKSLFLSLEAYEKLINSLSEEEFLLTPAEGVWSYSEVYSHIFQSNLGSLIAIEKCINGTAIENNKNMGFMAWAILFFGRFPPVKLKAPPHIAAMVKKNSLEEAKNLMIKFKKRLPEIYPQIAKASRTQKIKHPRLGLLNARQWFRFIEIHTIHHQKQLSRIAKILHKN